MTCAGPRSTRDGAPARRSGSEHGQRAAAHPLTANREGAANIRTEKNCLSELAIREFAFTRLLKVEYQS